MTNNGPGGFKPSENLHIHPSKLDHDSDGEDGPTASEGVLLLDKDVTNSHLYVKTGSEARKRVSPTGIHANASTTSLGSIGTKASTSSMFSDAGPDDLRALENIGKSRSQQMAEDQVAMLRKALTMTLGIAFLLSLALASTVFTKIPASSTAPFVAHEAVHASFAKRSMHEQGDFLVLHDRMVVAPSKDSPTHNDSTISHDKVGLSLRQLDQMAVLVTVSQVTPSAADAQVPDAPGIPHGPPVQLWDELQRMGDLGTADATIISALADGAAVADIIQDPNSPSVYTKCFTRTRTLSLVPTVAPAPAPPPPAPLPPSVKPSNDWYVQLGAYTVVPNRASIPTFPWTPDGHLPVLQDTTTGQWMLWWSEYTNYRSTGNTPYPEDHTRRDPSATTYGGRFRLGLYYSGGMWLMSVFRLNGTRLIGFYHAEDRWTFDSDLVWKSIGVTYSSDNGRTWQNGGQILTHWNSKPGGMTWGGVGDMDVVYDSTYKRWVCYFSDGRISMAYSYDPNAAPGTWTKYYNGQFTEPGIGGRHSYISRVNEAVGANPSVHFNTYLGKWVMVWGSWTGAVYISSSVDGVVWDQPKQIITSVRGFRAWYPSIIGDQGDRIVDQNARIYYADFAPDKSRDFARRSIRFVRND